MQYMILDSAGNALASFDDEASARATLHAIVKVEPDAAEHVVLLAYGDDGMPIGDAVSVADVPPAVTVEPAEFLMPSLTNALIRQIPRASNRYVGATVDVQQARVDSTPPVPA